MGKRVVVWGVAGGLALAGCSAPDTTSTPTASSSSSNPSITSSPGSTGPASGAAPATTGTTPGTIADGCTTSLTIINVAAATGAGTIEDGPVDIETAWSDQGPHPKNTVDEDRTLDVALAGYEIPKDPQFGYTIPIGVPAVPDGKLFVSFRLTVPTGKIAAGQTFYGTTIATKGDGTVSPYAMYLGRNRLLPGDPRVTITKVTDDRVCGTITSVPRTSAQSFVGIDGTFGLDRIQSLEARDAAGR